jgi:hypothetical protein
MWDSYQHDPMAYWNKSQSKRSYRPSKVEVVLAGVVFLILILSSGL